MPIKLVIFGNPVSHSLSPRIHRAFGRQVGIEVDYQPIETSPETFAADLEEFAASGGVGANLTVPVKPLALPLCRQVDQAAEQAGAVNTLVRSGEGWSGHNTDGAGLLMDFDRLGIEVRGKRVLILGAGGAARGILGPLLERRPAVIRVLNRSPGRALELADRFTRFGEIEGAGFEDGADGQFDMVIQVTSLGHRGACPPLERSWLNDDTVAYDLNYGAAHEPFRGLCHETGVRVYDGLGMLGAQAALSFEMWTGRLPEPWGLIDSLRT